MSILIQWIPLPSHQLLQRQQPTPLHIPRRLLQQGLHRCHLKLPMLIYAKPVAWQEGKKARQWISTSSVGCPTLPTIKTYCTWLGEDWLQISGLAEWESCQPNTRVCVAPECCVGEWLLRHTTGVGAGYMSWVWIRWWGMRGSAGRMGGVRGG